MKQIAGLGFPLVLIEWVDSSRLGDEWLMLDDVSVSVPHRCVSVGFLIKRTKEIRVLVPHFADVDSKNNKHIYGGMMIPTCAIIREFLMKP